MSLIHQSARPRRRAQLAILAITSLVLATLTLFIFPQSAQAAATISNNTSSKVVTITGARYALTFSYNLQAVITSLQIDGHETLDTTPVNGIYSAVRSGSNWYTTQSLTASPSVSVSGNVVTATLSTAVASETWTFTATDTSVAFALSRTYNAAYTPDQQGSPMLNFAPDVFDNIRWPADGGNYPVGGALANAKASKWIANGAAYDANARASKESTSFTLLNRSNQLALAVTGSTSNDSVARGSATEISRATSSAGHDLRLGILTSSAGLAYATGSTLGYNDDSGGSRNGGGMTRGDGGEIFSPTTVASGHTDTTTLTFTPATWSSYYDLGTLKGVDQTELSALINDYVRLMMQNPGRGASTEQSVLNAEVPPLEMQWITQLLEVMPDPNAINAVKSGLSDIGNYLVDPTTGKTSCCRPNTTETWQGKDYYDEAPGFVIGVANAYRLSGDTAWLTSIAPAVRRALNYEIANDTDPTTHLVTNAVIAGQSYQNDYWESSVGATNGYTTALLYEALTKWSQLESDTLNNSANASSYSSTASTISTNFNLPWASGGFWSPTTNTFFYGSGNADALYLPVNAEVLKSNIASPARDKLIVQAIEAQDTAGNYDFHPMNTLDVYTPGQAAPTGSGAAAKIGENGGWYGAPDGDYYAGLPGTGDPQLLTSYISSFLDRYASDGFYGGSTFDRVNWTSALDPTTSWFNTTAMPAWGLYHYQYGFQPADTDLLLAPFVSPNEVGSVVKWTWRGNPLTVTYNSQVSVTIAAPVLATNIRINFINQTPGTTYHVQVDGGAIYPGVADANGNVGSLFSKVDAGTHTFACIDCVAATDAGSGATSAVTAVTTSGTTLRNDVTQQVGMKFTTGSSSITVRQLGRYYVAGNSHVHTLKLLDASAHILGTATVDESAGTPDALGFKYGSLDKAVTLAPNTTYYLYSLETSGGDQWYDYATSESTTSALSINSAAYGQTPVTQGGSSQSYGPLNFKY